MIYENPALADAMLKGPDDTSLDYALSRPFLYNDHDGSHEQAAEALIAHATANMGPFDESDTPEMLAALNPEFALPAAYIAARKIYDLSNPTKGDSTELSTQTGRGELTKLERHLTKLLNDFSIRSAGEPDLMAAVSQEGEESLGHAVTERANKLADTFNQDSLYRLDSEDPTVLCEALGQLCAEELARIHATAPQTPDTKVLERAPIDVRVANAPTGDQLSNICK